MEEKKSINPEEKGANYVYLLRCADGSFYCGWTTDLTARVAAHNSGHGAKYTRSRRPVELVYFEEFTEKGEALSREWHIKRLSRKEKEALIEGGGDHAVSGDHAAMGDHPAMGI